MSKKSKRAKRQPVKGRNLPPEPQPPPKVQKLWASFLAFATIFGVVQGLAAFAPRTSADPSALLNPADPFTAPFVISNDGIFSIHSVEYSCNLRRIETHDGNLFENIPLTNWTRLRNRLSAAEKDSFHCPLTAAFKAIEDIKDADIEVSVSFRPSFLVWTQTKSYRHVAAKTSDGNWQWLPKSVQ